MFVKEPSTAALMVACMVILTATGVYPIDDEYEYVYTGEYDDFSDFNASAINATHCGIITNFPFRQTFPAKFKQSNEDCMATKSGVICEVKIPSPESACPQEISDWKYGDSCYERIDGWHTHAYIAGLCPFIFPSARLVHIEDDAELKAIGGLIALDGGVAGCGVTAEFAMGNTAPPAAA